jgi:hypothetical protein
MTEPTPTPEQLEAAEEIISALDCYATPEEIARLLADRDAKLMAVIFRLRKHLDARDYASGFTQQILYNQACLATEDET